MPINPDCAGYEGAPAERSWTSTDGLLYALGVGAGRDELAFTTENTADLPQRILPTMGVVLNAGGQGVYEAIGPFDLLCGECGRPRGLRGDGLQVGRQRTNFLLDLIGQLVDTLRQAGARDGRVTDTAAAEHGHAVAAGDAAGVDSGPDARHHAAAEQARDLRRCLGVHLRALS